ncbi:SDR family NAD(P)-dependent oxidoreductase [Spiribacter halobius]|uniref:Short-chain dehydrogenase n=1 Tax=Sediminicurvatus halobius TaxID=2182432 RepID=A0A2U2N6A9_9GAMM|nr:SDR family NAD(P)-dependent oxidoreductase [Spiribacter halobius]PWG64633.1 short-chain dehydrogenase [Spiribacter halobius]UEX79043.1 SDR family NAD(P)-dependent oxidoreductase [Spiribacter halobius]
MKPVCIVNGVGPGNGAAFARRFATEGYAVALVARSREFSEGLAAELGADARAYTCDLADPEAVAGTCARIADELGTPTVLLHNAGGGIWGDFQEIDLEGFEQSWRVNALGLLAAARAVAPGMRAAGGGSIVVTGATASRRGGAKTAAFASAKAAQRSLAESLAKRLWPDGIHVSLIIVDGVVDLPRTRERMPDKPDEFFLNPDDIAATAWWLTRQPRSAWSFEVEARPFGERW